jgi:hypothetical protein
VYKEIRAKRIAIGDTYVDNASSYGWEANPNYLIDTNADWKYGVLGQ